MADPKQFLVTGTWTVYAETAEEAQNAIENAVAKDTEAELVDCEAEEEE